MYCIMCNVSCVMCHQSPVTGQLSLTATATAIDPSYTTHSSLVRKDPSVPPPQKNIYIYIQTFPEIFQLSNINNTLFNQKSPAHPQPRFPGGDRQTDTTTYEALQDIVDIQLPPGINFGISLERSEITLRGIFGLLLIHRVKILQQQNKLGTSHITHHILHINL